MPIKMKYLYLSFHIAINIHLKETETSEHLM